MLEIFKWKELLILTVLIRLLIMPFYFHPDIKTFNFQASFLRKGVVDIYSYLAANKQSLSLKEEFVYFPLTYFFVGGYQILVQPLLGSNFDHWLADPSREAREQAEVFRYLFILKLPYLVLDFLIGFLLCRLVDTEKQRKRILMLWLLNPLSIILIYAFSNIDIVIVALTLLSLLAANRGKIWLAALCLGLGAGFKAYPVLFIPFLILSAQGYKQKILVIIFSLLPLAIIIGPFLKSASFQTATLTSGLMTRLTLLGINMGFGEALMVGVVALSALFFWGVSEIRLQKEDLCRYYVILLLLIFSFIHFHIQWLLWILPLALLVLVKSPRLAPLMTVILSLAFAVPLLYEDKAMTVGLLSVISPLYDLLPVPFTIVQKAYDPYTVQSMFHSIFAGGSLVLVWQLLKTRMRGDGV